MESNEPEILTIPELAARAGIDRRAMWRRVVRLAARDPEQVWLLRDGRRFTVNVDLMKKCHPHFAKPKDVQEIVDDHEHRLAAIERILTDGM